MCLIAKRAGPGQSEEKLRVVYSTQRATAAVDKIGLHRLLINKDPG